jgi:sodium pump decarboxylase gamma subunit
MDISSVFLTNDANEPKKYPVPLGDVKTEIPPRQHVIFWADNEPNKGTFHLSFKLEAGKDNWIGIYDADGITLIDSVTVPAALVPNVTWAREADGEGAWEVRDGSDAKYITPSSNNVIIDTNNKVDMFAEKDSNGFVLTLMAMAIVFSALLVLSICFYVISKIGEQISRVNKLRAQGIAPEEVAKGEKINDSGEEIAAIVMALHEHLNAHDQENTILTINKVKRAYSPWSSKIYGLRELPRR